MIMESNHQLLFCIKCLHDLSSPCAKRTWQIICANTFAGCLWTQIDDTLHMERVVKLLEDKGYILSADVEAGIIARPKAFIESEDAFMFCTFCHL